MELDSGNVEKVISTLEKRADDSEKAIENLLKMVDGVTDKSSLIERLEKLLKLLHEDREECEKIQTQRNELTEENERLRMQIDKHKYRIKHLLRTIESLESEKK
ncbi:unnamed protein product [Phytomonas sp. Hart1]|nr:unnamed protein product [Phytomonas sp. Hart1]|eukprot:CCW69894.1 unnamed protein product [Phytomonas sp. isolate Hart1]